MKIILMSLLLILNLQNLSCEDIQPEKYEVIPFQSIFSDLIQRKSDDRIYSGQISTLKGLEAFVKSYEIQVDQTKVDFQTQMIIFGITDQFSTRAMQFLYQKKIHEYTLDYAETGIKYSMVEPKKGNKYSYLQLFVIAKDKVKGIPHIAVKNSVQNGLSKVFE